jgi:sigma-B regulation protein RsbU (phosphoserine phosphatase)
LRPLYDILAHDGRITIGIGDVTGHGLESGMLMLMTQTAVRTLVLRGETDPKRLVQILNRLMYENAHRINADKSVTLSVLTYHHRQVRVSGQHEDVIVVRKGGALECIDTVDLGFPLGLEKDIAPLLAETEISLEPGDGIVLYTDGITEAENASCEFYGLDDSARSSARTGTSPPKTLETLSSRMCKAIAEATKCMTI